MSKSPRPARHPLDALHVAGREDWDPEMRHTLRAAAACLAATLPLAAAAADNHAGWATPDDLSTLRGTWRSPAPEPWYGGYGTREFVFADGEWSLIFTHALDPDMTLRTFRFRTGGGYEVGAPGAVPGAYRTVFDEDWKHVTLLTDDPQIVGAMGMADCGLTPNLETDISATGCAAWKPVAECGEDHDLFGMDADGLRFGVRPADNDMCDRDRTPEALLPAVVRN